MSTLLLLRLAALRGAGPQFILRHSMPCRLSVPLQSVARDIMLRLKDTQPDAASGSSGGGGPSLRVGGAQRKAASNKSGCC